MATHPSLFLAHPAPLLVQPHKKNTQNQKMKPNQCWLCGHLFPQVITKIKGRIGWLLNQKN